jgi:hypothetical protein
VAPCNFINALQPEALVREPAAHESDSTMIFWTFLTTVRELFVEAQDLQRSLEKRYPIIGS